MTFYFSGVVRILGTMLDNALRMLLKAAWIQCVANDAEKDAWNDAENAAS